MRSAQYLAVLPLALLLGVGAPATDRADACQSLNASSLEGYRSLLGTALAAARADAQVNGTTGRYAVAATNTRDALQRAYDRATEMVNFNRNQGDRNPNSTTYVEAGNFTGSPPYIRNGDKLANTMSLARPIYRSTPSTSVRESRRMRVK